MFNLCNQKIGYYHGKKYFNAQTNSVQAVKFNDAIKYGDNSPAA